MAKKPITLRKGDRLTLRGAGERSGNYRIIKTIPASGMTLPPEADPQVSGVPVGLSPEMIATFKIFRRAAAFEILVQQYDELEKVNLALQDHAKRSGGRADTIRAQFMGQRTMIERNILMIIATFRDALQ